MFHIACTRFNNTTYCENIRYRDKNNEKVIYGSPLKIRNIYGTGCLLFVAEMNNETNKIEGIGLIKNSLICDRRHKIYENGEYNRYIYRGKHWISRLQIEEYNSEINNILNNILFKGRSHLKCRIGITVITEKLFTHWNYELKTLKNLIVELFHHYYSSMQIEYDGIFRRCSYDKLTEIDNSNITYLSEEVEIEVIPVKRRNTKINKTTI